MLHILRVELQSGRVVLVLHGCIAAESVALLERECEATIRSGARAALDLRGVTLLDRSARMALRRLGRSGIEIGGCSPTIAAALEQDADEGGAPETARP
jgi:anti-anti-sigma regulatory factor